MQVQTLTVHRVAAGRAQNGLAALAVLCLLWTLRVVFALDLKPQQQNQTAVGTPHVARSQKPSRIGLCFTEMSKYLKMPFFRKRPRVAGEIYFEEPGLDPDPALIGCDLEQVLY